MDSLLPYDRPFYMYLEYLPNVQIHYSTRSIQKTLRRYYIKLNILGGFLLQWARILLEAKLHMVFVYFRIVLREAYKGVDAESLF